MAQTQNQFGQAPVQGMLDLLAPPNTISVQVDASQGTALVPGQAVKMVDSAGGVPKVIAAAANTDDVFGFVNFSWKQQNFAAGQSLEMSVKDNVMYMVADGAISRGASVTVVPASNRVVAAATGNTVVGRAYDKAVNAGDLIRVWITTFGALKQVSP